MNLHEFEFIPLSQKNKDSAVEFLSPVEESCVTLMSRIYDDFPTETFTYFILYQNLKNEKKNSWHNDDFKRWIDSTSF